LVVKVCCSFVAALAELLGEVVAAGGGLAFVSNCNCLRSILVSFALSFQGFCWDPYMLST
ncbi:unnamed protein product, partial [Arabidopsis halleri]